jgi:hypothetical protein
LYPYYIFDIPIYQCTKKQYVCETEAKLEKHRKLVYDEHEMPRPTGDALRHLQLVEGYMLCK